MIVSKSSLFSSNLPITVLKFGGSVLRGPHNLTDAVAEVARSLEKGSRVVVVTSAFAGVTERLLTRARKRFRRPAAKPLASLLATGESRSAAYLALALADAGIDNELLDPDRVQFRVTGSSLDGEPLDIDTSRLLKALSAAPVVVIPGFFGRSPSGSVVLLGRGGSDLTALFLAERLGARECRLVKDVDGLFSRDPSSEGHLERYVTAEWEELERVGVGLVQEKAVTFAREHRLSFTIAAPLSDGGTVVGPGPSRRETTGCSTLTRPRSAQSPSPKGRGKRVSL
jgi:homoserine dehydrogenase